MIEQNRHRFVGNSFWVRNDCHVNADRKFKVEAGVEDTFQAGETRIRIRDGVGSVGVPIIESKISGTAKDGTADETAQMSLRYEVVNGYPRSDYDQFVVKQVAGKGGIKIAFTPEGIQLKTQGKTGEVKLTLPGNYSKKRFQLPSSPNVTEVRCTREYYDGNYIGFALRCIDSTKSYYQSKNYSYLWTGEPNWPNPDGTPSAHP